MSGPQGESADQKHVCELQVRKAKDRSSRICAMGGHVTCGGSHVTCGDSVAKVIGKTLFLFQFPQIKILSSLSFQTLADSIPSAWMQIRTLSDHFEI